MLAAEKGHSKNDFCRLMIQSAPTLVYKGNIFLKHYQQQ